LIIPRWPWQREDESYESDNESLHRQIAFNSSEDWDRVDLDFQSKTLPAGFYHLKIRSIYRESVTAVTFTSSRGQWRDATLQEIHEFEILITIYDSPNSDQTPHVTTNPKILPITLFLFVDPAKSGILPLPLPPPSTRQLIQGEVNRPQPSETFTLPQLFLVE
jgi:hypothetical protein